MRLTAALALGSLVLSVATARGDDDTPPEGRSPALAVALSLGGAAAGFGVMGLGKRLDTQPLFWGGVVIEVFGPSVGDWYAGEAFDDGLKARLLGGAIIGGALVWGHECHGDDCWVGPLMLLAAGSLVTTGGTLLSVYEAPQAARRFNARHELQLTPTAIAAPGGPAPGLVISGSF